MSISLRDYNKVDLNALVEVPLDVPQANPLRLIQRRLRGRYRLTIVLAIVFASLGGFLGWAVLPPEYASTGLVRIEAALPSILYTTQKSQVPPLFDSYIAAQVVHLQSRQVVDAAVNMPQMRPAGWPGGPAGVAALQKALDVRHRRGEQVIAVSVTHRNPHLAHTAVNAVLTAFGQTRTGPGGLSLAAKEEALVEREQDLERQRRELGIRILQASEHYGREAVYWMHASKVDELLAIDQKLAEIRLARNSLKADGFDTFEIGQQQEDTIDRLSALKQEEVALTAEIRTSHTRGSDPVLTALRRQLEAVRIQIRLYQGHARSEGLARLDQLEAQYKAMRDDIRDQATKLGQQRIALASLTDQETEVRDRLAETRRRLDEIRFESSRDDLNGVSINFGALPVAPVSDRRRSLATVGVIAGMIGGVGVVFLLGLLDPRIRFLEELEALDLPAPVIAVLPDLERGDGPTDALAADGLDQLRQVLELHDRDPGKNVYAITSCDQGDGRSSLTLALGASFAAAGRKTVVVDADFVGSHLSHAVGLVDKPGLCDAVFTGNADNRFHPMPEAHLWAMPVGSAQDVKLRHPSPDALNRLFGTLRGQFDAILVDAGAMLAGAEASLVSAVSDRAVLVVGRNQKGPEIRSSWARLSRVGANCVGLVFTAAATPDLEHLVPIARLTCEPSVNHADALPLKKEAA